MTPAQSAPLRRRIVANARRLVVAVVGASLALVGIAMIVLPGPGVLVVAVGLAVLATEFAWAARALHRTTTAANRAASAMNEGRLLRLALAAGALVALAAGVAVTAGIDQFRSFGIGAAVGGLCTLVMLAPATSRWLERTVVRLAPPSTVDGARPDPSPVEGTAS